jgi:hypothetical protein
VDPGSAPPSSTTCRSTGCPTRGSRRCPTRGSRRCPAVHLHRRWSLDMSRALSPAAPGSPPLGWESSWVSGGGPPGQRRTGAVFQSGRFFSQRSNYFDVRNKMVFFLRTTVFEPSRPQAVLLVEIDLFPRCKSRLGTGAAGHVYRKLKHDAGKRQDLGS